MWVREIEQRELPDTVTVSDRHRKKTNVINLLGVSAGKRGREKNDGTSFGRGTETTVAVQSRITTGLCLRQGKRPRHKFSKENTCPTRKKFSIHISPVQVNLNLYYEKKKKLYLNTRFCDNRTASGVYNVQRNFKRHSSIEQYT